MRKMNFWLLTINLGVKTMEIIITIYGIFFLNLRDLIPFSMFLIPVTYVSFILLFWVNKTKIGESRYFTLFIILTLIINISYTIYDFSVILS